MSDDVNQVSRRIATLEQEVAELKRKLTRLALDGGWVRSISTYARAA